MVAKRQPSLWRWGAALGSIALAVLLGSAALLIGAAATAGPWTALQPIPISTSQHVTVWKVIGDPNTPQDLAAATSRGVWISSDDGQSWTATSISQFTWTVAYGNSGSVLYAGTASAGVFRSTNSGQSWRQVNTGLHTLDVRAIATGPTAIVLGTQEGVYVSGDGTSWERAGMSSLSISAVAIIASNPLGVLAGADQVAQQDNLFLSLSVGTDSGWQSVPGGDPGGAPVFSVAAGPLAKGATSPPLLVGSLKGLYASSDGGTTWQAQTLAGGALWSVDSIAFDPDNPAVIYVGGDNGGSTGGGLQRTVNGGTAWAAFSHGLPSLEVTGLSTLSTTPLTVLASTWNPVSLRGRTARALDSTAPGPVALSSSSGTPISVAVSPTPTPSATPRHHHTKPTKGSSIPIAALVAVLVVLILVAIALGIYLRRRRQRLEAEAPP
ncbi:MAG TPA: hypothetical protein VMW80_04295 [Candidatus Dormibacteraeota bacterium]|nr:hypothetical protein [Candidatus Dormibacteraeota bacterium]